MRSKILTLLAVACSLGFVQTASAADMPTKMPAKAPVMVPPPYNWTGFYIGGVVGYGSGKSIHCDAGTCALPSVPAYPEADPKGWNGGVTVGYNWQSANWVLGAEGDWSWANMHGASSSVTGFGCGGTDGCYTKIKSFETLRGRVGYAFDRFLPYVTGGIAWTQLEASIGTPVLQSGSTTKSSFTVGGGVEYAFWQNLSAKVEYLYIAKLGDFTYAPSFCAAPGCFVRTSGTNLVRIGLNYRFTGF